MATVYLASGNTVDIYNQSQIYGSSSVENVIIRPGATNVTLSPAVERAHFSGSASDYLFAASGASLKVYTLSGDLVANLTAGANPTLLFADGGFKVGADPNTGGILLGGTAITAPITAPIPAPVAPNPDLGQSLSGNESANPSDPSNPGGPSDPSNPGGSQNPGLPSKPDGDQGNQGADDSGTGTGGDDSGSGTGTGGDDSGSGTGTGGDSGSGTGTNIPSGHKVMVLQVGNLQSSNVTGFEFKLDDVPHTVDYSKYVDKITSYEGLAATIKHVINTDDTLSTLGLQVMLGEEFTSLGRSGSALGTDIVIESKMGALKVPEEDEVLSSSAMIFSAPGYFGLREAVTALPPHLSPTGKNNYLVLEIIDGDDAVQARDPAGIAAPDGSVIKDLEHGALYHNPFTAFKFTLDDGRGAKEYTINLLDEYNWRTDHSPTYAELAQMLRNSIAADPQLKDLGLEVALGDYFDTVVPSGANAGKSVLGKQIVLSSNKGAMLGKVDNGHNGWVPNDKLTNVPATPPGAPAEQPLDHMITETKPLPYFPDYNPSEPGIFPALNHWLALDFVNHDGVVKARDEGTAPQYGALADNPFTKVVVTDSGGNEHEFTFKYDKSVDITPTYEELLDAINAGLNAKLLDGSPEATALGALGLKFELGARFATNQSGTTAVGKHQADLVNGTRIVVSSTNDALKSIVLKDALDQDTATGWYQNSVQVDGFEAPKPTTAPGAETGLKIAILTAGANLTDNQFTGMTFTYGTGLDDKGEVKTYTLDWSQYNSTAATKYTGAGATYTTLVAAINKAIEEKGKVDAEFKAMDLVAELGDPISNGGMTGNQIILSSKNSVINRDTGLPFGTPNGELGEGVLLHKGVADADLTSRGDMATNLPTYTLFAGTANLSIRIINPTTAYNGLQEEISHRVPTGSTNPTEAERQQEVLAEQNGALLDNPDTAFTLLVDDVPHRIQFGPYQGTQGKVTAYYGPTPVAPGGTKSLVEVIEDALTAEGLTDVKVTLGNTFDCVIPGNGGSKLGHGLQVNISITGAHTLAVPEDGVIWDMEIRSDTGDLLGELLDTPTNEDMHVFYTDYALF